MEAISCRKSVTGALPSHYWRGGARKDARTWTGNGRGSPSASRSRVQLRGPNRPSPRSRLRGDLGLLLGRAELDFDQGARSRQLDLDGGARRLVGLGRRAEALGPFRVHRRKIDLPAIGGIGDDED